MEERTEFTVSFGEAGNNDPAHTETFNNLNDAIKRHNTYYKYGKQMRAIGMWFRLSDNNGTIDRRIIR